jgi:6-aminohexanoate-oligomer endohydrolase
MANRARCFTRRRFFRYATNAAMATQLSVTAMGAEPAKGSTAMEPQEPKKTPVTNDTATLAPQTTFDVPTLEFDFPALQIGVAAYKEGPTGCTVFRFQGDPTSVIDVRGGSPGTVSGTVEEDVRTAAICFAGGSIYGMEAASGVAAELFAQSGYQDIKLVRGAVVWDFWRENKIYPDKALGRAALKAARTGVFPMGRAGAGVSVGVAGEGTGQGGAFRQVGETKIAVFTVVNASGVIVDRQGKVVRGNLDKATGERKHHLQRLEEKLSRNEESPPPPMGRNTTLTLLVTNQRFGGYFETRWQLRQWARQVHSSMAWAIQPFHSMNDGDVLFAVTTGEVENRSLNLTDLGLLTSELVWDAVLNSFTRKETT